jgi:tetratricopeptide (TPR) repeat protein
MRRSTTFALLALAALSAACPSTGGGGAGRAERVAAATPCEDEAGLEAWEAARAALARQDDRAALPLLRVAVARCERLVRAHVAYQDAARRLGGADEAAMVAFYAAAASGDDARSTYLRARLAETAYAQANGMRQLLTMDKRFAWAHLSLGQVNRGQGRLSEALADLSAALKSDASLVEARLERASVLVELGRDKEAAVDIEAYLLERPDDEAAAREYVSLLVYRLGRIEAALEWIARLQERGDVSVALQMDHAAATWRQGSPGAAVDAYVRILEAAPDTARAALNVGLLYYEVLPEDEAARLRWWPKARAAFRMFLQARAPTDGYEQFERTLAVPFRLRRIEELLGPPPERAPTLAELRRATGG